MCLNIHKGFWSVAFFSCEFFFFFGFDISVLDTIYEWRVTPPF